MPVPQSVAIITGASQGIGAGLVDAFRRRNYCVIANSLSIKSSNDPAILTIAGDVSKPETASQIVGEGLRRFGRIDTLVNNAGMFLSKQFTDYTEADFAAMLATNLAGFFHVTQAAIVPMLRQGSGHIVNITASLADQPSSQHPSLLASLTKGGLNAATRALAIEYAAHGVRVNAVAPGTIKTPMHPDAEYEGLENFIPLRRVGEVSDVVDAVLFLETDTFVTGQVLHVDGGRSAGL